MGNSSAVSPLLLCDFYKLIDWFDGYLYYVTGLVKDHSA